jgi:Sec-independent protein translocase protein TatA
MLDNFGLGEFFLLAILALLFFGPERLPQIGAKLGQWTAKLTQYSRAFMTEWRDEALAIHDAVQEVQGIRDEIAAARAEIAGTLATARNDVDDALSDAKLDVQQQVAQHPEGLRGVAQFVPDTAAPAENGVAELSGKDDAIAKTQQILTDLEQKRARAQEQPSTAAASAPQEIKPDAPPPLPPIASQESSSLRPPAPVQQADLDRLRDQVDELQEGMRALREELARFRDELESSLPAPDPGPAGDVQALPATTPPAEPVPTAVPVGEVT